VRKLVLPLLLAASPAFAHAKLISSDPAPNARVKAVKTIKLSFSEKLEPAFSGANLADAAGKAMPVPSSVAGKVITLLPMSLKPGRYTVAYRGVGHDTHRIAGSFTFEVTP
jgi:methionine-rich copper-binding protein CopC